MSVSDDVRNFVERDKALCAQALDDDRGVLVRAAEMIDARRSRQRQRIGPDVRNCGPAQGRNAKSSATKGDNTSEDPNCRTSHDSRG